MTTITIRQQRPAPTPANKKAFKDVIQTEQEDLILSDKDAQDLLAWLKWKQSISSVTEAKPNIAITLAHRLAVVLADVESRFT